MAEQMNEQMRGQSANTAKPRMYRRFSRFQMSEHALLILAFTTLSITGLPQKYPDAILSHWVIIALGGIDVMRILHRIAATLMTLELLVHLGELFVRYRRYGLRGGMLPRWQDFKDARQQVLYYLGVTKEQPRFDRFGYREKFEYFGVIWGSVVMILTGMLLWEPEFFTRLIPGWLISAARAAHSGEALLAVLTIVIWHMYNAIVRPDIFPLDKAMLTGHISAERFQHEHPLEYEREVLGKAAQQINAEPAKAETA